MSEEKSGMATRDYKTIDTIDSVYSIYDKTQISQQARA